MKLTRLAVVALLISAIATAQPHLLPEARAWASMSREQLVQEDQRLRADLRPSAGPYAILLSGATVLTLGGATIVAAFATVPGGRNNGALGNVLVGIGGGFLVLVGVLLMGLGLVKREQQPLDHNQTVFQIIEVDEHIAELDRIPAPPGI